MPSPEAEKYLTDAAQVKNHSRRGKLTQPATRYLRHNERNRRKTEAKRIKAMLDPINVRDSVMGPISIGQAQKHLRALEEDLEMNSPPTDLSGETKDALYRRLKEEEALYKPGFLTWVEMRRNGVGAVDKNIRHQKKIIDGMTNKDRGLFIKNLRILLNPDSEDQDLCNLEDLRDSGERIDGAATYDPNAQIAGVFAMTPAAKANFDETFPDSPTIHTPLKHAEELERMENEIAELKAKLAKSDEAKKIKREAIAANKQAQKERMKKYWADKRAAQAGTPRSPLSEGE